MDHFQKKGLTKGKPLSNPHESGTDRYVSGEVFTVSSSSAPVTHGTCLLGFLSCCLVDVLCAFYVQYICM